ncbi:hypothetical protein [Coxiella endosymbiont of Ornithodoros maritimus]|uniref:hypothetical protein n=1 Tax=Coxiella endosymbiont of Ornithodoros maritimus TaxID=1656172 RepID=UPI0022640EDE|nr:hypothetical protein [Coxiella endosymbiont of Ornithodoros maritimus]
MVAALCARNQLFPAVKVEGCWNESKPLVMFVSDHAHYSVFNAADTIRIGEKNVVRVEHNKRLRPNVTSCVRSAN